MSRPSLGSITADWHREHARHADDYPGQPWGIQWGGPGHVEWVRSLVEPHVKGKHIYEIGCGGGKYTRMLFECGALTVVATDVHEVAIAQSREYEPRAFYYLTDGETIPFDAGAGFDVVFTYDVLLHLPPGLVVKYLQEAHRVAGEVIVQLPTLDLPASRACFLDRIAWGAYRKPYSLGYYNFYTDEHIRTLISLAGWSDPTILGHNLRDSLWLATK